MSSRQVARPYRSSPVSFITGWPCLIDDGLLHSSETDNRLELAFDCTQFAPEECLVNVSGSKLSIEAHHEESTEHSFCKRDISRTYTLPSYVNPQTVKHSFGKDGELIITAEKFQS
uniref:SHSP domain-containing protein n=1 Tax=Rhabditophanes sp. KR3021 TaxID=114890 RepID=A0AC35TP86_9BILA